MRLSALKATGESSAARCRPGRHGQTVRKKRRNPGACARLEGLQGQARRGLRAWTHNVCCTCASPQQRMWHAAGQQCSTSDAVTLGSRDLTAVPGKKYRLGQTWFDLAASARGRWPRVRARASGQSLGLGGAGIIDDLVRAKASVRIYPTHPAKLGRGSAPQSSCNGVRCDRWPSRERLMSVSLYIPGARALALRT